MRRYLGTIYVLSCLLTAAVLAFATSTSHAQQQRERQQKATEKTTKKAAQKKPPAKFSWVNPLKQKYAGVQHAKFRSPSMKLDVGYCIYLPPGYSDASNGNRRYPVVYYLHGGRPGSEIKSVRLAPMMDEYIRAGHAPPMIYVFVNGGPVSHYNMPDRNQAMGEDVFTRELIPHVDRTYRTIAKREGRGLEGFSQGGRGTARIM